MYKINFNQLHCFTEIVRHGGLTKAAKALHITQPALSHQLRLLEEDLGQKLFHRKGRGLKLNEFGEKVYTYANNIFRESEEMLNFVKNPLSQKIKVFNVGVMQWIPKEYIFQLIKPLISIPQIKINVIHTSRAQLIEKLDRKELDIILIDAPFIESSFDVISKKVKTSELVCIASANFPNQTKKFPEYLDNYNMINYQPDSHMRNLVELFFKRNQLTPPISTITNDVHLMVTMTAKGAGIAIVPEEIAREQIKLKNVKKLKKLKDLKLDIWAVIHQDNSADSLVFKAMDKI